MRFEQIAELLTPEKLPYPSGIERLPDGILHVAAMTRMPGVTPPMMGWWLGEYLQTTEHYRRWHPRDHVWMDWADKEPGAYIGAKHLVHEYVGGKLSKLQISFVPPEEFGLEAVHDTPGAVAICARPGLLDRPLDVGRMVHLALPKPWGCELHSRFWLGYVRSRKGSRAIYTLGNHPWMRRRVAPDSLGRALLVHCHEEMTILSSFLPALHEAETRGG